MKKKAGEITAQLGEELSNNDSITGLGFTVVYDHPKRQRETIGVTSSWIGTRAKRGNRLSEIDIAIIRKKGNRAILLIEIEESNDRPKNIIGDVMTTLIGDGVSSRGRRMIKVGSWTTLLVLAKGNGETHEKRIKKIEARLNQLTRGNAFKNLQIGKRKIRLFQKTEDLNKIILPLLNIHPQID